MLLSLIKGRIGFRGYTTEDLVNSEDGALVLGGANLSKNGIIDLRKKTFISWDKYYESPEIQIKKNDIIFGQRGTCGNAVLIEDYIGKATINPSLILIRPLKIKSKYLSYWMMASYITSTIENLTSKTAVPMLSQEQVGNFLTVVPTEDKQHAIAAYLDKETARIDALIAKKERQIELLQEKRQAIITRAITKGLDPNAKMKDSGVEWIGAIPEGWEVRRLKAVAPVQGGYAFKSESFQDEGVPVIRMNNLKRGEVWVEEAACVPSASIPPEFLLAEDDILIGMSGSLGETGSLGNYAIVKSQDLPLALNQRVGRFRVNKKVFSIYFLKQIIQSKLFTEPISLFSNGTAQFNISSEQIGSVFIPCPSLTEQVEIAKHCDLIIDSIKIIQEKLLSSVSLLREYRSALITAAVSGQIDVSQEVQQ